MTTTLPLSRSSAACCGAGDTLALHDVDHVRLFVGNAKQSAHYWASAFGFQIAQVADLTTGSREEASYLLTQGNIRMVLTSALHGDHPAAREVERFGDGVKDIAFTVRDAKQAFELAVSRGGVPAHEPTSVTDDTGSVTTASVKTFGRVVHTFISREGGYAYDRMRAGGAFLPFFKPTISALNQHNAKHAVGLLCVDHLVGNVRLGEMNPTVAWYEKVMGFNLFKHFDDKDISTEYSALMSKVMDSGAGLIKIPINEPAEGRRKSQVQEYLDFHDQTPGVQHLAFRTDDALQTVSELHRRGVEFLHLPDEYYEHVWSRVAAQLGHEVREDHERIHKLGILVDADDKGYLLQIFTKPVQDRPTLFIEIICRRGSDSFGKGNFRALFESLELEQQRRGNL